jgi:hypothetical protein
LCPGLAWTGLEAGLGWAVVRSLGWAEGWAGLDPGLDLTGLEAGLEAALRCAELEAVQGLSGMEDILIWSGC